MPLVISGLLFLAIYIIGTSVPEEKIRGIIENAGPFGPLVIILLIWLTQVIAPLGALPFLFAGFYLYGQSVVTYVFVAAVLSSISNFWIARIWGRRLVTKIIGQEGLNRIDQLTENYGHQTLFAVRVFLREFHDVISYIFGLTTMRFLPYFVISILGTIPGTLIWYYLSSKIHDPLIFTLLSWALAYFYLGSYLAWVKIFKKEKKFTKLNKEIRTK